MRRPCTRRDAGRGVPSRSRASRSPRPSAPCRPRSCWPPGVPRPTTSPSRASTGPAAPPTPAAPACSSRPRSTTRCSTRGSGSPSTRAPPSTCWPSTRRAASTSRPCARRSPPTPARSPWSASCGPTTRSAPSTTSARWPRSRTSSASRSTPTPSRPSAPLPVDFAASGVDALSLTGHKLGGPVGAGALLLRRDAACTPLLHGGGQERDVRSGTLDVPGVMSLATAVRAAVGDIERRTATLTALRDDLVARVIAEVPDARLNGVPLDRPGERLPGNAHLSFPGCEGDSLLMLLDARGIECSTGSACTAGVARPSHVLLAMGLDERPRPRLAALLARPQLHGRRRRRRRRGDRPRRRARPPRRGRAGAVMTWPTALIAGAHREVLAAMSGGVDSAVAAARLRDAGHEVTGVHLALSAKPATMREGARGCCSVEDSRDARRCADVLDIPFYVWDLADPLPRRRRRALRRRVRGRAHARTRACGATRRSSSRRCWSGRGRWASTPSARATTRGSTTASLRRAVDPDKDQSYVLGVLRPDQLAGALFPLGDSPKAQVRAEAAARGLVVAEKPDSHDICFIPSGDTRGVPRRAHRRGAGRDGRPVRRGRRAPPRRPRLHRRPAPRPRHLPARRRTGGRATCSGSSRSAGPVRVGPAEELDVTELTASDPVWLVEPPVEAARLRRPGPRPRRSRRGDGRGSATTASTWCSSSPCAGSRPARRPCSTGRTPTGTSCSAARRSPPPRADRGDQPSPRPGGSPGGGTASGGADPRCLSTCVILAAAGRLASGVESGSA